MRRGDAVNLIGQSGLILQMHVIDEGSADPGVLSVAEGSAYRWGGVQHETVVHRNHRAKSLLQGHSAD